MDKQGQVSSGRLLLMVSLTMIVTTLTISIAFYLTKGLLTEHLSPGHSARTAERDQFPKRTQWSQIDRLDIPEKGYSVARVDDSSVCYLLPYDPQEETPFEARPLVVTQRALNFKTLEQIAGREASQFCAGFQTYWVRRFVPERVGRRRRESDGYPSSGIFATAVDKGKPAIELDIEERHPRCVNVLLDCFNHVGKVQLCYTWQNGAMFMERKCLDQNKFEIKMTKPPGRILKVAQQQLVQCLERKDKGLDC